jgi:predicted ATPase with chaperone activity
VVYTPCAHVLSQAQSGRIRTHRCGPRHIRTYCELSGDCEHLLERAMQQQGLSARAHDRILKLAPLSQISMARGKFNRSTSLRGSNTERLSEGVELRGDC